MSFSQANILTTRQDIYGSIWAGQILPVPSGRLDKIALYLEPVVADSIAAESIMVVVSIYALDGVGKPTGPVLVSDSRPLSEVTVSGFLNFRLSAAVPTPCAVIVRVDGGDSQNHVAWRYVNTSAGSEEMLISGDSGANWTQKPDRKFAYQAFSFLLGAINPEDQTAAICPGVAEQTEDHTNADWTNPDLDPVLDRTAVEGDTVVVNFGNFVVTLVVDQSGSMTWNDATGLRYTLLKQFVADIDASLPAGSTATYSLFKFRGRKVGKLTIEVQGSQESGLHLDGIRIVRKPISVSPPYLGVPTGINDGVVLFEGLAERFTDDGSVVALTPGDTYGYAAFPYANLGGVPWYSEQRTDYASLVTPIMTPYSVATFTATVVVTDVGTDLGHRQVNLAWKNPAGANYDNVIVVRRPDRPANSPSDLLNGGEIIFDGVPTTTSVTDTYGGTYEFINGLTYYYTIFTVNSLGIKCLLPNAQQATAAIPVAPRPWEETPTPTPPPGWPTGPVTTPTATLEVSNGEIRISWTATGVRYKLYFKETAFSSATDDKGTTYDGTLLSDGTATIFTHRSQPNGQPCFYTVIALDRVGNASAPAQPLIGLEPPRPSSDATVYFPPDPVTNFSAEAANGSINLSWNNPTAPTTPSTFYFGDQVRVTSNVEFIDQGTSESFITYEFVEEQRNVVPMANATATIDPQTAIRFASVPSINSDSISCVVSVTPSLQVQNQMESASISIKAVLSVKQRTTGVVLAKVETSLVTVTLTNPFTLAVGNEPQQQVSRREWVEVSSDVQGAPCQEMHYKEDVVPGVYVMSGIPFFALLEASYRGTSLGAPLNVTVNLLDPTTGNPSTLMVLPQTGTTSAALTLPEVQDEVVDRSGTPTGETQARTMLALTLPPSNVAGQVMIQAVGQFQGYTRTVFLTASYEPILNVDMNLLPFQPDGVDITEQSCFVYLAPYTAEQSAKIPVTDMTVTSWSIRSLCTGAPARKLYSTEQGVLGLQSFTRGGIAQKIFWGAGGGPGDEVIDEQTYEVNVSVQANGMKGEGHGIMTLQPFTGSGSAKKLFLRKQGGFNTDTIYADGLTSSVWEVLGHPEDDTGSSMETGESFVNAVLAQGGTPPPQGIADGRVVQLNATLEGNTGGFSQDELKKILDSLRITTNMTGPNGKSRSAQAQMMPDVTAPSTGLHKAVFSIKINSRVPIPSDAVTEAGLNASLQTNIYYGIPFTAPTSGIYIVLTAFSKFEVNGHTTSFVGGGKDLVNSAPPCFLELVEPLRLA